MSQLTLGASLDLGQYTLVLTINSALSVPVTKGYKVKIAKELGEKGVTVVGNRIKFPAKSKIAAVIVVDTEFEEVQVRVPSKELAAACFAGAKTGFDMKKVEAFLDTLDPNGELVKVIAIFFDDETGAYFKALLSHISEKLAKIDTDKLTAELQALAAKNADKISAPEPE